jgi:hydrogenase expression/formation protein HypC
MCLAVPMRIIEIDGSMAVVESRGVETKVNTALVPDLQVDDRVIVHAGFVIERLDPEEADKIDELWDQYEQSLDEEGQ